MTARQLPFIEEVINGSLHSLTLSLAKVGSSTPSPLWLHILEDDVTPNIMATL
ncbi:hypothetical protein AB205_0102130 [Aquarana catesbeiana]|uniref:Uncharacterized protein n=1 Tax=Aquarana catesbeiana TaxID=8400 RepID=A0A2G9SBH8_AQUCT|nr:hypothetical protein AB205_0102130 [Aquarana catesbeiana]